MLTAEGCAARSDRLLQSLDAAVQCAIVADPRHLMYLANFPIQPISWSSPPPGLLLVDRSGKRTLFTDNLAVRNPKAICVDQLELVPWYNHLDSPGDRRRAVIEHFLTHLAKQSPRQIAVEVRAVPAEIVRRLSGSSIEPIDDVLLNLRRSKAPDELELIRRCIAAGEAGHARSWDVVRAGATELEVYSEITRASTLAAGQPVIVYGDFCSGPRTWLERGGPPTERRLEPGDLMILDFSVVIGGYRGDFTNTIAVNRSPSDAQRRLFELCCAAMSAAEHTLCDAVPAREVFQALNEPLQQAGEKLRLTGHGGHGIGLAHPEPPIIVPNSTDILRAGDVITLEPGAYVQGIGGMRFENNYLVRKDGFEKLTHHRIGLV